jgi:hypothetical protein
MEHRTNLVIKYLHLITTIIAIIVDYTQVFNQKHIFIAVSSVTTVVGVAMFAQWSILSNISLGYFFFSFLPRRADSNT